MIFLRPESMVHRLTMAALVLLGLSVSAIAQSDDKTVDPISIAPGPTAAELPDSQSGPIILDADVISAPLTNLDPAGMGLLTPANGGFAPDLWQGSDRDIVIGLMQAIPANTASPTMQLLVRRLTLSVATPPKAEGSTLLYLQARIERLYQAGGLRYLILLFEQLPSLVENSTLAKMQTEIALLAGNTSDACALAEVANYQHEDVFWLQMQAFCQAASGDYGGASFALDMAQELGDIDRDWASVMRFLAVSEDQRDGRTPKIKNDVELTPLMLVSMRAAGVDVPRQAVEGASPIILQALAVAESTPDDIRLLAGSLAHGQGALSNRALARVYGAISIPDDRLDQAKELDGDDTSALTGATLYQAAGQATDAPLRLQLLDMIWSRSLARGDLVNAAQMTGKLTQAIAPGIGLSAGAATAARVLIANGDVKGAMGWYRVLRSAASNRDANATTDLIGLWPLMQMAAGSSQFPWSQDILDVWWQAQAVHPGPVRYARGLRVFSIFEALGQRVPAAYWSNLAAMENLPDDRTVSDVKTVSSTNLLRLRDAARRGQTGETVMLALICLGEDGPAKVDPAVLDEVMRSLGSVDMAQEARSLALEAMIGNGL
jgi:hypothetical protein